MRPQQGRFANIDLAIAVTGRQQPGEDLASHLPPASAMLAGAREPASDTWRWYSNPSYRQAHKVGRCLAAGATIASEEDVDYISQSIYIILDLK
jgi:hypothetical protein